MNFRRFSSVLLLSVFICSVVFSASASASALTVKEIDLPGCIDDAVWNEDETVTVSYNLPLNPFTEFYIWKNDVWNYGYATRDNPVYVNPSYLYNKYGSMQFRADSYLFGYESGSFLVVDLSDIKGGSYFDITMSYSITYEDVYGTWFTQPKLRAIWLDENYNEIASSTYFHDWTSEGEAITGKTYYYNATVTFTVPAGSEYVYFQHKTERQDANNPYQIEMHFDYITFTADLSVFEYESKTMQAVSDKLDQMKQEEEKQTGLLGNILTGITNLPSKIGDAITNGIKNLFIPTKEDLVSVKDDWEQLLSDRFGAVYESTDIIDDFANAFTYDGTQETIDFPEITIELAGADFVFGGWEVDVIPERFDFLIDMLKLLIDIVCTFAFVNAMKKRLEGVLS